VEEFAWAPGLDLVFAFRLDGYAVLFLAVIGVAGTAIFWHAARYFSPAPRVNRFAGIMTIFAGSMAGLVASDHLLALFVFWELTTITSYLLIGYDDHLAKARSAALHAAVVTGFGGLAMLAGLVILGVESGSFLISEITAGPVPAGGAVAVAFGLVLLGAATKSAQFPFHGWLPGAMAAPTPASAFLHSATMVKAGIFLVGRLGFSAAESVGWWQPAIFVIGFITMAVGGWQALRQSDLKLMLAHGTVSQLGLMFLLIGSGSEKLVYGGLGLLLAHALFKAALFMVVGTIDHEAGTRELHLLSGLRTSMPLAFITALVASASMAALPLTFGFAAKEAAFDGLVAKGTLLIGVAAALSAITVAYTGRFLIGAFGPPGEGVEEPATAHDAGTALVASAAVLAGISLVLGFVPGLMADIVDSATTAVTGASKAGKLVIWPGLVAALGWSMASLTVGLGLVLSPGMLDRVIEGVRVYTRRIPTPQDVFATTIRGLLGLADRVTGVFQHGSLPAYVATILIVATVAPTLAALVAETPAETPQPGTPGQAILGLIIAISAGALVVVRTRFAAVILLGGVGYGIAGLFVLAGGPDLALTQLLVETLAIALFALVFRHLPARFPQVVAPVWRAAVGVVVALFVLGAGLVITASEPSTAVADRYLTDSVPEAAGKNVVNTILVDFRAFDTMGEIAVLAIAAIGVAGLVLPVLRRRAQGRASAAGGDVA
jgi:multicomponent Na+:H+ antiporter subunit A